MRCIALLFFSALITLAATETFNLDCKPGDKLKIYCNTCTCSDDGKKLICTENYCGKDLLEMIRKHLNQNSATEKLHHIEKRHKEQSPRVCTPNSEFRQDCEWCLCNNDGSLYSCTRTGGCA